MILYLYMKSFWSILMERNTSQFLLPEKKEIAPGSTYELYPSYRLSEGSIRTGHKNWAKTVAREIPIILDGYVGAVELFVHGFEPLTITCAKTFAVHSAAKSYSLINRGDRKAKVIVSFIKDGAC